MRVIIIISFRWQIKVIHLVIPSNQDTTSRIFSLHRTLNLSVLMLIHDLYLSRQVFSLNALECYLNLYHFIIITLISVMLSATSLMLHLTCHKVLSVRTSIRLHIVNRLNRLIILLDLLPFD